MGLHYVGGRRASAHAMTTKGGRTSVSASFLRRAVTPALLVLLLVTLCVSCGGGSGDDANMRAETPALQTPALQIPVDPALMDALQAELTRVMEANPPRSISTPPHGERAAVPLGYNAGNSSLYWGYHSPGDYDQNGIVNVSDLTPLGQNFGKTAFGGSFPLNSLEAVVDGDGNGEINLADVTPIGVNFGVQCSGYNIYVAENETAVPPSPDAPNGSGASLVDSMAFNAANLTGGRKEFILQVVPTAQQQHFWVSSTDGKLDGAASNSVAVNLPPAQPPQASVKPTGDTGTMAHIIWDATASFDPDGEIVSYEWDFDGDGQWDYTTDATMPRADFYYYEAGQFSATVRVTDDTQRSDSATAIVNITQVQSWQETVADERLDEGNVQSPNNDGIKAPVRLMEVDGRPAMIYIRKQGEKEPLTQFDGLTYLIADDNLGELWPEPVVIYQGKSDSYIRFNGAATVIDGLPAVSSYHSLESENQNQAEHFVDYRRAIDPSGTSWHTSNVLYSDRRDGATEDPLLVPPREMVIINDRPALIGSLTNDNDLDFARATTITGSSWIEPISSELQLVYYPGGFTYGSINGLLARVELINSEDLIYNRALDHTSENWSQSTVLVDEHEKAQGYMRLLEVVNRPALVYKDDASADMKYRRALDADGSDWGEAVILDPRGGNRRLAAIVDGRPAVLYDDRISGRLMLITANDVVGSYWGFPSVVTIPLIHTPSVLSGTVDSLSDHNQFTEIEGRPAFCYTSSYEESEFESGIRLHYIAFR